MRGSGIGHIDRECRVFHRAFQIALIQSFALLRFHRRRGGIDRHDFTVLKMHLQRLRGMAGLFKAFCDYHGDQLSKVGDVLRALNGSLVRGALGGVAQQALVLNHRQDARHLRHGIPVRQNHASAVTGRTDHYAVHHPLDLPFIGIGRGAGYFQRPLRAVERRAYKTLHHIVEPARSGRGVHLELLGHCCASSVSSFNTETSVRRARGILKSFAP